MASMGVASWEGFGRVRVERGWGQVDLGTWLGFVMWEVFHGARPSNAEPAKKFRRGFSQVACHRAQKQEVPRFVLACEAVGGVDCLEDALRSTCSV